MADEHDGGPDRRQTLKCMLWAGTGVVWTVAGGVPASRLIGSAKAAEGSFSFVQISDSHIGFSKPANPDARLTLEAAIDKILAMPGDPAFIIHTGDVTHTAQPKQFDDALEMLKRAKLDVHYAPGEHDILDPATRTAYLERFGKGATGGGWYSFDHGGVHFVSLVNVVDLKKNGLGSLGAEQLAWLEDDLKGKTASTPIVLFCHIPLWTIAPDWGWGTEDSAQALGLVSRFGSVTVLNGHIHQLMQKVEGSVTFHTARSTAFPQPAPGTAPSPGPKVVPAGELRKWLGVREVAYMMTPTNLAFTDMDLS
jgi:3',5'-cyclic-AMP phosphodiesterase